VASKRDEAKKLLDSVLKPGVEIQSKRDAATFERLTGTPHATLVANWKTGGIMTACNGFVGWYAGSLGIKGIASWFKLEASLKKAGKSHAWVRADGSSEPLYGDILHHSKGGTGLHVDVAIGFTSDHRLIRAAAGQTTFLKPRDPDREFDVLKRVTGQNAFDYHNLLGWLDLERYFASTSPSVAPPIKWVTGWWDVTDGRQWYYYFDDSDGVRYTRYSPMPSGGPPLTPESRGTYSYDDNNSVVYVTWESGTKETFTANSGRTAMNGRSNRYGDLSASRM
jgi:hypothetical protein